ncbi:MAG: CheY-like chemotaxis protein [Myxococcota bacterium]|jgi:CheY-like chemotaxis protein
MSVRLIRTLVVEDNTDDWLLVKRALNGGYSCVHVESMAEALAALKDHIFDLIISDLALPDVAAGQQHIGVEALRRAAPGLPIVVVTGGDLGASVCATLVRAGASTIAVKSTGPAYIAHLSVQVTAAIEQERYIRRRLDEASQAAHATAEVALTQSLDLLTAEIRGALAERAIDTDTDDETTVIINPPTDAGIELARETGGLLVRALRFLGPWGRRLLAALLTSGSLTASWWWLPLLGESCAPTPPAAIESTEGAP